MRAQFINDVIAMKRNVKNDVMMLINVASLTDSLFYMSSSLTN